MPDFFDRLLARSVPDAGTPSAAGTVRVRPRLPGPFERIEAVRGEPVLLDEPAPPPTVSHPAGAVREVVRHEWKVVTDRHTVVQAPAESAAPRDEPSSPVPAPIGLRPAAPLLRAAAQVTPPTRDGLSDGTAGRSERRSDPPPATTRPRSAMAAAAPAGAVPAPSAAVRPRAVDAAAARNAAKSGIGRRQQPAERVVHVRIGRLDVSAAAPRDSRNATAPARQPGRRAPALALDVFLSRDLLEGIDKLFDDDEWLFKVYGLNKGNR